MKFDLMKTATKIASKAKTHSPEMCMAFGISCFVGAIICAVKDANKMEEAVDVMVHRVSDVKEIREQFKDDYNNATYGKDLTVAVVEGVKDVAVAAAPTVGLALAGTGFIIFGHKMLYDRNVRLVAAYTALDKTYKMYRRRVIEKEGEEADFYYRTGARKEKIEVVDFEEDGKMKSKTEEGIIFDGKEYSQYARFFDEACKEWSKNSEYNLSYLVAQQRVFNQRLKARGHVFLNEVYDALGIPRTQAGAIVGWVEGNGDDYIDFGIFEGYLPNRNFVNGYERTILLDFNVDGIIYDKI